MEPLEGPAPKRRKLSTHSPLPAFPAPFSDYIVLARANFRIHPVDDSLAEANEDVAVDVNIRDVSPQMEGCEIDFSYGRGVRRKKVTVEHLSPRDLRTLQDAQKIESCTRYKAPAAPPLACAYTTIRTVNHVCKLEVCILWENTAAVRDKIEPVLLEILAEYLPLVKPIQSIFEAWEPRHFYDNVHVPEKSEANSAEIEVPHLESRLYPFQIRAVRWLLSREGVHQPIGSNPASAAPAVRHLPQGFEAAETLAGGSCYVNHTLGVASTDLRAIQTTFTPTHGGILADEMGLGKTLEIIALICLHPQPLHTIAPNELRQSCATLIITPPLILEQWKDELLRHAPALKVFHYTGINGSKMRSPELVEMMLTQDVVLTTYNVIAKEVHYVAERPDRNLRNSKTRKEPPKSPLTQISWWRVCLDEAQMVEGGISAAATVAQRIPRSNAWAVTGTPLRKGHRDLFGLLLFLRFEPWCRSLRLWDRLVTYYRPFFREMLGEIAMRHSKDFVREDLRLPPQNRHTITIPFTPIEEQHYMQLFQELCEDCDLDRTGAPIGGDWDPESSATVEKMRTWLTRLRQTCLHPEVGGRNRRALGRNTNGPLRTVDEVLDVMIDQHEGQLRGAQRSRLVAKIRRGQLQENAKASDIALRIWKEAWAESTAIVAECKAPLASAGASLTLGDENITGSEDEKEGPTSAVLARLRSALEVHHVIYFFIGNGLFQVKSDSLPETTEYQELEEAEKKAYEGAKVVRAVLLKGVTQHVNKLVTTIKTNLSKGSTQIPIMKEPSEYGGIESRKIFDKLHYFCEAMNVQAEQFHDLRKRMVDFLSQSLIDEDEDVELQGDEYENSTKHQDEMYAIMEALRALHADRTFALTGQENMLIKEEMKQFLRSAKEGEGAAPELIIKLLAEREEKRVKVNELGSLRAIAAEIRQVVSTLQWQEGNNHSRAGQELTILEPILKYVQQLNAAQTKALANLEQEISHFRDTMNGRLAYYKSLQKLSDQVAPFREETIGQPLEERFYGALLAEEAKLQQKIIQFSAKLRYLVHMKTESKSTAPRVCVICTDQFEVGSMTACGHQFCKECVLLWWAQHRTCPVCKTRLSPNSFHDITYKPAEIAVQAESPSSSATSLPASSDRQHDQSIYSDISTTMLNQIKNIELRGPSYGSKIDFLCRHLLWLREHDPGSKSIIFSQYREFIDVLGRAFSEVKISYSRIDSSKGTNKFKSDPSIECFLLHAKAHSAGLNLVNANHVFLCEPLINAAIELQAIARVHRIGQHRSTNVWMYLVADTVEESIYDISVTRRLAHMKSNNSGRKGKGKSKTTSTSQSGTQTPQTDGSLQENAIDIANSMELQAADLTRLLAAGKSGGEMVDKEDLWACLFGRIKRRDGVGLNALVESQPANTEVGRFLRAEAAESRTSSG